MVQRCQELAAGRAHDDGKLIRKVWDDCQVLPIIDSRNCWNDGDLTKLVTGFENVAQSPYRRRVFTPLPGDAGDGRGPNRSQSIKGDA